MVKVVTNGKVQVNPETDEILFDGEKIQYEEFVYIMMNKPKGVVSATEDNLHKTVLDLIDPLYFKKGSFPSRPFGYRYARIIAFDQ